MKFRALSETNNEFQLPESHSNPHKISQIGKYLYFLHLFRCFYTSNRRLPWYYSREGLLQAIKINYFFISHAAYAIAANSDYKYMRYRANILSLTNPLYVSTNCLMSSSTQILNYVNWLLVFSCRKTQSKTSAQIKKCVGQWNKLKCI